eukprot:Skav207567  [mRNA]  locus=scaffold3119:68919:77770:- [translate_table: standard]
MISCQMGNQQSCRTLLKLGADPNAQDRLAFPPIFIAIGCDHPELLHPLLDFEADPHMQWAGIGLLHAVASHCSDFPWDCMQRLLKEGLQVNEPCYIRKCGRMGFLLTVKMLMHWNLRGDYALMNGSTPLLGTILRGNVGPLRTLLRARADPQFFGTSSKQDVMQRSCIPERIFYSLLHEPAAD